MAVSGYFDHGVEPAPYVEARVYLPRLQTVGKVELLLDTGSNITTIHPRDIVDMGIRSSDLGQEHFVVASIGGSVRLSQETARVSLYDRDLGAWRYFTIRIALSLPDDPQEAAAARGFPSLLGRDILNRCRCVLDHSQRSVALEPFASDDSIAFALPRPL